MIAGAPLLAGIDGILRGLLPSGITVTKGMKAGDIDPRCEASHCFTVSDKALAVAGGVLEAILAFSGGSH
jgi:xanthine dehydrogenase accessory factor